MAMRRTANPQQVRRQLNRLVRRERIRTVRTLGPARSLSGIPAQRGRSAAMTRD
jgi:hypothetical protein